MYIAFANVRLAVVVFALQLLGHIVDAHAQAAPHGHRSLGHKKRDAHELLARERLAHFARDGFLGDTIGE